MRYRTALIRLLIAGALALVAIGMSANAGIAAPRGAGGVVRNQNKAEVTVVIQQAQGIAGIVTYEVRVTNRGGGPAKNVVLSLPYDTKDLTLLDVRFGETGAWTSALRDGLVEMQTGRIASRALPVTATVRFTPRDSAAPAKLRERISYHWTDYSNGGRGTSNLPGQPMADPALRVYKLEAAVTGDMVSFTGRAFVPGEPVTFWFSNAAGEVFTTEIRGDRIIEASVTRDDRGEEGRTFANADALGAIEMEFIAKRLPAGTYSMMARGNWSGLTSTAPFEVKK